MLNSLEFYSTKFGLYPRGDRSWGDFQSERLPPGPTLTRQEMFSACLLMLSLSLPKLAPPSVPLSPACHTQQLAIIGEGEAGGVKVQTDPVLSRRLGGDGEAALRAVLMGQKVLEEAVSSEHRWPGTCFQERNSGAIPIQAPTGQARDEGVGEMVSV